MSRAIHSLRLQYRDGIPNLEREILRLPAPRLPPHIRTRLPSPSLVVRFGSDTVLRQSVWGSRVGHPAMMHCGLLLELVRLYTRPKWRILDPFGGVGTTALAALLDREVILSEIEPHFVETARAIIPKLTQDVLPLTSGFPKVNNLRVIPGTLDNLALEAGFFGTACVADVTVLNQDSRRLDCTGLVHTVITSPPYLDTFAHPHSAKFMPSTARSYTQDTDSPNLARIRNVHIFNRGLGQVFQACSRVLMQGGLMVLVTKDPIRNGWRYPFALSCITTMQALGFELIDWWRRECIPTLFVNLKRQKNPDACQVNHEDVLVFSRYSSGQAVTHA